MNKSLGTSTKFRYMNKCVHINKSQNEKNEEHMRTERKIEKKKKKTRNQTQPIFQHNAVFRAPKRTKQQSPDQCYFENKFRWSHPHFHSRPRRVHEHGIPTHKEPRARHVSTSQRSMQNAKCPLINKNRRKTIMRFTTIASGVNDPMWIFSIE